MKLYNSLTKIKERVAPLEANTIRMYTCGPTVYDNAHIGNLSSYIFADSLKRVLKQQGFIVKHIMNFTDVDDKTIRRSLQKYPNLDPKERLLKLTRHYEKSFIKDMQAIGNSTDDIEFVRATDTIPAILVLITNLYEQGFAYISDDGVYFSIDAYKKSGKKYGQLLEIDDSNTSQARIANDEYDKDSVHDFALWKKAKSNEPTWKFRLGEHQLDGRPGWHIECSAMSTTHLGQPFDIHTGGVDLLFPHHENEIAQSTAGRTEPIYSQIFAHNQHLLVNGKKMSKSLNNFYTLNDITKKGFSPLAFRLMILQSHYRSQSNFTWETLNDAQNNLKQLRSIAEAQYQLVKNPTALTGKDLKKYRKELSNAIAEDLNFPRAFMTLSKVVDQIKQNQFHKKDAETLTEFLKNLDQILGLQLSSIEDISAEQKMLIQKREQARLSGDWPLADKLRNQLLKLGLDIRDTSNGSIWSRV